MKIAILYICTGKYNRFFKEFYDTSELYLLKDIAHKEYFVFTDDLSLSNHENVHLKFKKCQGFPADSLFRFDMFLGIKDELEKFDYIYFFNSNAKFLSPVGKEILPDGKVQLVGAEWPVNRKPFNHPAFYPYEKNNKSLAYISSHEKGPFIYFMGGINGGTSKAYLHMIETLAMNIRKDCDNGIIARVHDESHINRYFRDHPCKVLSPEYCLPEEFITDKLAPRMIFRNKTKIDSSFNKGRKTNIYLKTLRFMKKMIDFIDWYI